MSINILSVQIYSDQNTPWDRSKIEFPVIPSNIKWPGNGCGLCNSLFKIINSLSYLDSKKNNIYFDLISKDIEVGDAAPVSEILELSEMRSKYGYRIYDITEFDYLNQEYKIYNDGFVFRAYNTNRDLFDISLSHFIFNEKLEQLSKNLLIKKNLKNKQANLVHLRIDADAKNHIVATSGMDAYLNLVDKYRIEINSICDKSLPLVILMDETGHDLVKELREKYDVTTFEKSDVLDLDSGISGREIFALVDLLAGKNLIVENYIGHIGSSFSIVLSKLVKSKKTTMI